MAGHSKWKTTKRKKAVTDSRRAQVWTKLIREITVAAKAGGGDPSGNARLRKAIDDGRAANMPNENIERAVKKGTGELEGASYEEVTYEGYGPGGAAMLIEGSTDNPNRTVAEIRHAFSRNNGNLGATNSVSWMFEKKGQILIPVGKTPEDQAMEDALDAGASDFAADGDYFVVTTEPNTFHAVIDALKKKGYTPESAEIEMVPKNLVKLEAADAQKLLKLVDALEELDDVSKVFTNLDLDAVELEEAGT
jgi:YebC/PmpR family DNA-binding regulatory protein